MLEKSLWQSCKEQKNESLAGVCVRHRGPELGKRQRALQTRGQQMTAHHPNPAHHEFSRRKLYWNVATPVYAWSLAAFILKRQSQVVRNKKIWPAKPKKCIIWPFTKRVC